MKEEIIRWIRSFYEHTINGRTVFDAETYASHSLLWSIGMLLALLIACLIVWHLSRFVLIRVAHMFFDRTKTKWDDFLIKNKFFRALAYLIPLMFMEHFISIVFYSYPNTHDFFTRIVEVLIVLAVIVVINRFLTTVKDILLENERFRDKPIQSYVQVVKIIVSIVLIVVMISILTGIQPGTFLASLGAASAIVLLIFKDTILGFVGSLQLGTNDMVRIGDWVTMEKYGADGTVEEISLATVKVRNFDRTITTIPTYSMVSDAFKNWRGMTESDGRRIKRSVKINIETVKFADEELLEKLKGINVLKEFITKRQAEIQRYNEENGFVGANAINGRRQTNLGIFRKYIEHYLRHKVEINKEMSLMVRQLEPTESGIPLEVYCFTKTKVWDEYESIQSDIFDHILSMVHYFDLRIFEQPSGNDFRSLNRTGA
ncbi:mechanosensitive ion channel [Crocinitomicaceae bacterium CZZ-1]|uniref:Mechanosensing system component YbdG n=1 Tax=Taishania pollutisoli TaxID=2766479 RepID=A0A8J6PRF0_9FLAO|nr:mechanosensitive ion channel domain-containing protein [Taishania pollutisoli]MBC9813203.1 mechanosensitive ion channel [Taishania pollutisoli]MBX2950483.1 mechanosensitive ion channel [Crocinitomicaceae bacterium]NGF76443.1 mechanosensitive ion channel [Fluviicola sp. SGL-29]